MVWFGGTNPPPPVTLPALIPNRSDLPYFQSSTSSLTPCPCAFTPQEIKSLCDRYLSLTGGEDRLLTLEEFSSQPELFGLKGGQSLLHLLTSTWEDRRTDVDGREGQCGWFPTPPPPLHSKASVEKKLAKDQGLQFECYVTVLNLLSPKVQTKGKASALFLALSSGLAPVAAAGGGRPPVLPRPSRLPTPTQREGGAKPRGVQLPQLLHLLRGVLPLREEALREVVRGGLEGVWERRKEGERKARGAQNHHALGGAGRGFVNEHEGRGFWEEVGGEDGGGFDLVEAEFEEVFTNVGVSKLLVVHY